MTHRMPIVMLLTALLSLHAGCGGDKKNQSGPDIPDTAPGEGRAQTPDVRADTQVPFSILTPPDFVPRAFSVVVEADTSIGTVGQSFSLKARTTRGTPKGEVSWAWHQDGKPHGGFTDSIQLSFSTAGVRMVEVTATDTKGESAVSGVLLVALNPEGSYTVGDVDGDGVLSEKDLALVEGHLAASGQLKPMQFAGADVDLDGKVTQLDVQVLATGVDSGLAPQYLSATEATLGTSLLMIHPALLAPSALAEIRFGPGQTVVPVRVEPGYASFVVPPKAVGVGSVKLIVDGQEAAEFPLQVHEPPAASPQPGSSVTQALKDWEEALQTLGPVVHAELTIAGAEEQDVLALVAMVNAAAQAAAANRVAFEVAFEKMEKEGRAAFEQIALANGLPEAAARLERAREIAAGAQGLPDMMTPEQGQQFVASLCAATELAAASQQIAAINDIAGAYLIWFDWWPASDLPILDEVIGFLADVSNTMAAVADILAVVEQYLPQAGAPVLVADQAELDAGASATLSAAATVGVDSGLCVQLVGGGIGSLGEQLGQAWLRRVTAHLPLANQAFEAADFAQSDMDAAVALVHDVISDMIGKIVDEMGVEKMLAAVAGPVCDAAGTLEVPLLVTSHQADCGPMEGESWTCSPECGGTVTFTADVAVCGQESSLGASVVCEPPCADCTGCCAGGSCMDVGDQDNQSCGSNGEPCAACPEHHGCNVGQCTCTSDCVEKGAPECVGDDIWVCTEVVDSPPCNKLLFSEPCINDTMCVGGKCACLPDCDGKSCGPDGCGEDCGYCSAAYVCLEGNCVEACGNGALDDGEQCDGEAGSCPVGQICEDCLCVADEMCCRFGDEWFSGPDVTCEAPAPSWNCNPVCCKFDTTRRVLRGHYCTFLGGEHAPLEACKRACCKEDAKVNWKENCLEGVVTDPSICSTSVAVYDTCAMVAPTPGALADSGLVAGYLKDVEDKWTPQDYCTKPVSYTATGPDARARVAVPEGTKAVKVTIQGFGFSPFVNLSNPCQDESGGSMGIKDDCTGLSDTVADFLYYDDTSSYSNTASGHFFSADSVQFASLNLVLEVFPESQDGAWLDLIIDSLELTDAYEGLDLGQYVLEWQTVSPAANVDEASAMLLAPGEMLFDQVTLAVLDNMSLPIAGPNVCPETTQNLGVGTKELYYAIAGTGAPLRAIAARYGNLAWPWHATDMYVLGSDGTCIAGIYLDSEIVFETEAAKEYTLILDGNYDSTHLVTVGLMPYEGPANHSAATAQSIDSLPASIAGTTQGSSRNANIHTYYDLFRSFPQKTMDRVVYYSLEPSQPVKLLVSGRTPGDNECPVVAFKEGDNFDAANANWVASVPLLQNSEEWCQGYLELAAGGTYYILVASNGSDFELELEEWEYTVNGSCANAAVVDEFPFTETTYGLYAGDDFSIANTEPGYQASIPGSDLVYEVTVPAGNFVQVTEDDDAYVYATLGSCPDAEVMTLPQYNFLGRSAFFLAAPDEDLTYYVIVDGFSDAKSIEEMHISFTLHELSTNVDCPSATVVDSYPFFDVGSTAWGVSNDYAIPNDGSCGTVKAYGVDSPELVYTFDTSSADALSFVFSKETQYTFTAYAATNCDSDLTDCYGYKVETYPKNTSFHIDGLEATPQVSLFVDGFAEANGTGIFFMMAVPSVNPPLNDTCDTAFEITEFPFTYVGSNYYAAGDYYLPAQTQGCWFFWDEGGDESENRPDVVLKYTKKDGDTGILFHEDPVGWSTLVGTVYIVSDCSVIDQNTCVTGFYLTQGHSFDISGAPVGTTWYFIIDAAHSASEPEGIIYLQMDMIAQ